MIKIYKVKKFRQINQGFTRQNFLKKISGGYTIIETMIAISVFLVVIMSGMAALLNANLVHQKSQNMRSIMDNLSFIMEDMGRNLRTGYSYHCIVAGDTLPTDKVSAPKSCASGWGIAFEFADGGDPKDDNDQWVYYINSGKIFKSTQGPANLSNFFELTPEEVIIDPVSGFSVIGAESVLTNSEQPLATIRLIGKITYKGVDTPFSLQTSVSQRAIDIK